MKKASVSFIIFITLIGLVFGGFLLSNPEQNNNSSTVDTTLLYRQNVPNTGSKDGSIKITVFSNYLCPYCANAHQIIKDITAQYEDKILVYHRNLIVNQESEILTKAALAAYKQNSFKQFNEILFERELEPNEETVISIAKELGLDIEQFKADINSEDIKDIINQDDQDARSLGIMGTPTLFINDKQIDDFRDLPSLIQSMI